MPAFRLTLAYDGTNFGGSQVQPNQRTVQGELERACRELVGERVRTVFSGRTDRGVHAVGQVAAAHFLEWRSGSDALERALNTKLPDDIAASDVTSCDESFHPRFDATWREYRYWIAPGTISPFVGRYAWTPRADVDMGVMADAAVRFAGRHDFASFAGGGEGVPWSDRAKRPRGTVRTVLCSGCREIMIHSGPGSSGLARVIEIRIAADGFLPRMVRNIVGALVEVGQGRQAPDWIDEILGYRDRRFGSVVAPACGLTLSAVGFDGDVPVNW